MSKFAFVSGLRAAIHKSYAPVAVSEFIEQAAYAYADNGGIKVSVIGVVMTNCQTTDTGKSKAPASGTLAALILEAMTHVLATADKVGGRPQDFKHADITPDEKKKARHTVCTKYAEGVRSAFDLAVSCSAQLRKDAAEKKKAERVKPAELVTVPTARGVNDRIDQKDSFEIGDDAGVSEATAVGSRALAALALLTDDELTMLAGAHGAFVNRMAAIMGSAAVVAAVVAGDDAGAALGETMALPMAEAPTLALSAMAPTLAPTKKKKKASSVRELEAA